MRSFVSGKQVECKARQDRGTPGSIRGHSNAAQPMTSEFTLVGVDFCFTLSNSFLLMFKATCKQMAHKYREKFETFELENIATVLLQSIPTILTYKIVNGLNPGVIS